MREDSERKRRRRQAPLDGDDSASISQRTTPLSVTEPRVNTILAEAIRQRNTSATPTESASPAAYIPPPTVEKPAEPIKPQPSESLTSPDTLDLTDGKTAVAWLNSFVDTLGKEGHKARGKTTRRDVLPSRDISKVQSFSKSTDWRPLPKSDITSSRDDIARFTANIKAGRDLQKPFRVEPVLVKSYGPDEASLRDIQDYKKERDNKYRLREMRETAHAALIAELARIDKKNSPVVPEMPPESIPATPHEDEARRAALESIEKAMDGEGHPALPDVAQVGVSQDRSDLLSTLGKGLNMDDPELAAILSGASVGLDKSYTVMDDAHVDLPDGAESPVFTMHERGALTKPASVRTETAPENLIGDPPINDDDDITNTDLEESLRRQSLNLIQEVEKVGLTDELHTELGRVRKNLETFQREQPLSIASSTLPRNIDGTVLHEVPVAERGPHADVTPVDHNFSERKNPDGLDGTFNELLPLLRRIETHGLDTWTRARLDEVEEGLAARKPSEKSDARPTHETNTKTPTLDSYEAPLTPAETELTEVFFASLKGDEVFSPEHLEKAAVWRKALGLERGEQEKRTPPQHLNFIQKSWEKYQKMPWWKKSMVGGALFVAGTTGALMGGVLGGSIAMTAWGTSRAISVLGATTLLKSILPEKYGGGTSTGAKFGRLAGAAALTILTPKIIHELADTPAGVWVREYVSSWVTHAIQSFSGETGATVPSAALPTELRESMDDADALSTQKITLPDDASNKPQTIMNTEDKPTPDNRPVLASAVILPEGALETMSGAGVRSAVPERTFSIAPETSPEAAPLPIVEFAPEAAESVVIREVVPLKITPEIPVEADVLIPEDDLAAMRAMGTTPSSEVSLTGNEGDGAITDSSPDAPPRNGPFNDSSTDNIEPPNTADGKPTQDVPVIEADPSTIRTRPEGYTAPTYEELSNDAPPTPELPTPAPLESLFKNVDVVVKGGDTVWKILENQLSASPEFKDLSPTGKNVMIDTYVKYLRELRPNKLIELGFKGPIPNIDKIYPGDALKFLNTDKMDPAILKGLFERTLSSIRVRGL